MPEQSDGVVRDDRRSPFCYQTHDALAVLRATFTGNRRATALAIYLCLTEAANRTGGAVAREGFAAARKEIAEAAGVSADTLDRYVAEMETAGILRRERRRLEGVNLPNVWVLVEPGPVPPLAAPVRPGGSRTDAAQGLKEEPKSKEGETSSPSSPPALERIEGRYLGMDALSEECNIREADPRYKKEVVVAMTSHRGGPNIRDLYWQECLRYVEENPDLADRLAEVAADPDQFERALARAIRAKAAKYREVMAGAFLTPAALRKWWVSVEEMRPSSGGLTPEEIERFGAEMLRAAP